MVDNIPEKIHDILKITPLDENILEQVFEKRQFIEMKYLGMSIPVLKPKVLLATKLKSLPDRTKDHKKWKDFVDITTSKSSSMLKFARIDKHHNITSRITMISL